MWRKNRQPNAGSPYVGTDLNRNWAFAWGCCGGSSTDPSSETYRGLAPFSAPETTVLSNFVTSRRMDGVQQIKVEHRLPQLRRADPVALRLHVWTTRADAERGPAQHVRGLRAGHGRHERLHAGSRPRTCTSRRRDRRLAVGRRRDLRLHVRDAPEDVQPRLLSARRGHRRHRRHATARRYCGCWRSPTARTARSASRRSTAAPRPRRHLLSRRRPRRASASASATGASSGDAAGDDADHARHGLRRRRRAAARALPGRGRGALHGRDRVEGTPAPGARAAVIARRTLSLAAGTRTMKLRLRAAARRALRARRSLAATATVTTLRAGRPTRASSRVTLRRSR